MESSNAHSDQLITLETANKFAEEWIAAWNSHDVDRILWFYRHDVAFSSPVLARLKPETEGHLKGRDGLRAYWTRGLSLKPDLKFQLIRVLSGISRCIVHYQNEDGRFCAESFVFDSLGSVIESHACVELK
jgi:hypothetical protein